MAFSRWGILLAGLTLAVSTAVGGTIHPALQQEIDQVTADTPISALVYLAEQAPVSMLSEELSERDATRRERHRTIVTALQETSRSQADLLAWLDARMIDGGVIGYTSYWITNLVVVYATKLEIELIATREDVDLVDRNFTVELIEPVAMRDRASGEIDRGLRFGATPGLRAIRAPEVWNLLGYTGAGRLLANCDTGVDGTHPALRTRWRGHNGEHPWQECWLDVIDGDTWSPTDTHGHGTHVMGTMTGLGAATGDTIGVAWDAKWIACNAINQAAGGELDNDIITSLQWFADPDGDPGTVDDVPDVVQNSWGVRGSFGYPHCYDIWWDVIDNCEAAGVVTVWSAGNEGPYPSSMRSPADRATSPTNAFSVGAVNATSYDWPYPIADFSSRGPSECDAPAENLIKPEVVAPGVDVYSSVPGSVYDDGSGTSMAGPHAAGIVALMRQANPNLEVGEIKTILMATARDEGDPGNDNTFGWGLVDAYEAVLASVEGLGEVEGTVTNESWYDEPIRGVSVTCSDYDIGMVTDETGLYHGWAPFGPHTIVASREGFAPDTAVVELNPRRTTVQNFGLIDIAGPEFSDVTDQRATTDTVGPYSIEATVTDYSTVASVKLFYRTTGDWIEVTMNQVRAETYAADIPGMPENTRIDYYIWASDGIGLERTSPDDAPNDTYTLRIMEIVYTYDVEEDQAWQLGHPDDTATTGHWERCDPVGTEQDDIQIQPEDDNTPDPGIHCFVTGNGEVGGEPGDNDVDNGCTTLISPDFDLSAAEAAYLAYHRWYAQTGAARDDTLAVDVSNDGGETWWPLERVDGNQNSWQWVYLSIDDVVPLTDQVRFRVVACDIYHAGFVEAALDDISIMVFSPDIDGVEEVRPGTAASLLQNRPNPFNPKTTISFVLSNPADATLVVYDVAGRRIRTLVQGKLHAGAHNVAWDGRDDMGRSVESGVYLYKLDAGAFKQSKRMTILK